MIVVLAERHPQFIHNVNLGLDNLGSVAIVQGREWSRLELMT